VKNLKKIKCTKCGQVKSIKDFAKDVTKKCGFKKECRSCRIDYYNKHKERIAKSRKIYRINNPEKFKNISKIRWENNKVDMSVYNKAYNRTIQGHYSRYKRSAKSRKHIFELDYITFAYLVTSPCVYCGKVNMWNGVDRVDSRKGYTKENCVSCCTICNIMKLDLDLNQFKQHIKQIYDWLEVQ
jgi:hypothetical protein